MPSERCDAIKIQQTHLLPAERRLAENKFNVMDFMFVGTVYADRRNIYWILCALVCLRVFGFDFFS